MIQLSSCQPWRQLDHPAPPVITTERPPLLHHSPGRDLAKSAEAAIINYNFVDKADFALAIMQSLGPLVLTAGAKL